MHFTGRLESSSYPCPKLTQSFELTGRANGAKYEQLLLCSTDNVPPCGKARGHGVQAVRSNEAPRVVVVLSFVLQHIVAIPTDAGPIEACAVLSGKGPHSCCEPPKTSTMMMCLYWETSRKKTV